MASARDADAQAEVDDAEAVSLLGRYLYRPSFSEPRRQALEQKLKEARAEYQARPQSPDALIWYGRRTAYLGHYRKAIEIFTTGIKQHPKDARMYRHRGHRHISVRSSTKRSRIDAG